jgi:hypothetical protein
MLSEWAQYHWTRLNGGRRPDPWPPTWALPAASIAGLVVVVALITGIIVPIVRGLAGLGAGAAGGGAGWLHDWVATRIVLDPVRSYLTTHSAGLPISADTLWWTWCATGAALFLFAWLFRAVAARLGWIHYGAATAAMVWATSTGPGRPITTAIAVLWWTAFSLLALRRPWGRTHIVAHPPDLDGLAGWLHRRLPPS